MRSQMLGAVLSLSLVAPGVAWAEDDDSVEAHAPPPILLAIPAADPDVSAATAVPSIPLAVPVQVVPVQVVPVTPAVVAAPVRAVPAPEPEQSMKRQPARYGVGLTAGFSSGVGISVRLPMGDRDRLMVTIVPVITRTRDYRHDDYNYDYDYDDSYRYDHDGYFSAGLRWQRYVAPLDHVKFYSVAGVAMHQVGSDRVVIPGIGFGFETGGLSYRGVGWWCDITYSAIIDDYGLAMLAPLPQTGLIVSF